MGSDFQAIEATDKWRSSVERVLEFAELAAPVAESDYGTLSVDEGGDPEEVLDRRISGLLSDSDEAVDAVSDDSAKLSLLLADLEVADVLTTASQAPADVFSEFGLEGGDIRFDEARIQISVLQDAALGRVEAHLPVPKKLTEKLDALQKAAGGELVDIAKSPITWAAVQGGISGIGALVGEGVTKAFKSVKKALKWLKRAAMKVIEWVVKKLTSILPDGVRAKLKELMDSVKDKLKDGAPSIVGTALGHVLGREGVEDAWTALTEERVAALEPRLDGATKVQLTRIGYVTTGRKAVNKFEIVIVPVLTGADLAPPLRIVSAALVAAIVGFVGFQVWDGFRDIKGIATSR